MKGGLRGEDSILPEVENKFILLSWLAAPFVSWLATPSIPLFLRLVIFGPVYMVPPLLGGGLIAEILGKRRDYMPYM